MRLYNLTIAVSAFLLFQIQPIIARFLLPWFGGSAAVWTTCLLFFQCVLLAGYGYAHLTSQYLKPRPQCLLHIGLLLVSLFVMHLRPEASWKPTGNQEPTLGVLWLLLRTVGLPYFLLSATSPLVQIWYVRQHADGPERIFPYRLYALSNAGSLLALLSYPILVEPNFPLQQQARFWTAGYVLFVIFCGLLAWVSAASSRRLSSEVVEKESPPMEPSSTATEASGLRPALIWVGLAFCSSMLLSAVTNHLTANIAAIPFLWLAPLSLYLISFIVCFGGRTWGWRWPIVPILPIVAMAYAIAGPVQPIYVLIPVFLIGLTTCCFLCHGELARRKPPPERLTGYYLWIAFGGALGSLFVAVIAPHLFLDSWELPIAIAACALVAPMAIYRQSLRPHGDRSTVNQSRALLIGVTLMLILWMGINAQQILKHARVSVRNFYGVLRVRDIGTPGTANSMRVLTDGAIRHGAQFLRPEQRRLPITYYGPDTGIGLALRILQRRGPLRIGVIGLGAGLMATYGRMGDQFRFYEINPLVVQIARTEFTYLSDTPANVQITLGDGRLALEQATPQQFDLLAMDAFSGDSIPVHLLTREAFTLYFRHLKPDGVLAIQVSNRYLDLAPVVGRLARAMGKESRRIHAANNNAGHVTLSDWILIPAQSTFFTEPLLQGRIHPIPLRPGVRLWTDDYSSLYGILKGGGLFGVGSAQ